MKQEFHQYVTAGPFRFQVMTYIIVPVEIQQDGTLSIEMSADKPKLFKVWESVKTKGKQPRTVRIERDPVQVMRRYPCLTEFFKKECNA